MKHAHHDLIVAWAADTSRPVEALNSYGHWYITRIPAWNPECMYRFKPETLNYIVVNGVNVPEPVRLPLEDGQEFWLASPINGNPYSYRWDSSFSDKHWLSQGLIHLTREAAQAHIDAMLLPSRTDK